MSDKPRAYPRSSPYPRNVCGSGVRTSSRGHRSKKGIKFLAGAATGEDLDGDNTVGYMYSDKDGNDIVCRYNPKTGEYAKGIPGWRLITYFKPKWETGYGRHNRKGSEKYYLENKEKDLSGGRR